MNQAELTKKQIVICSYILSAIIFISFGGKVGSNGIAYLGVAIQSISIFLFFNFFGVADMIGKMIRGKKNKGFYKDAVVVRGRVLVIQAITGIVLMAVCFFMAPVFCGKVFGVPYGVIPLQILSVLIFLHSLEAMFGGYFQSVGSYLPEAIGSLIRVIFTYLFSNFFAGRMLEQGKKVSALLMNSDFDGMYGAIGLSIGFVIGEALVLVFYLFLYLISDRRGEKKRIAGGHQKVESMGDTCHYFYATLLLLFATNILTYLPGFAMFHFLGKKAQDVYANAYLLGELYGKYFPVVFLFMCVYYLRFHVFGTKMLSYARKQDYRSVAEHIGAGLHYTWCIGLYFCVMLMALANNFSAAFFADDKYLNGILPTMGVLVFASFLFSFAMSTLSYLKERVMMLAGSVLVAVITILYYAIFAGKETSLSTMAFNGYLFGTLFVGIVGTVLLVWKHQVRLDYIRVFVIPLFGIAVAGLACIFLSKLLTPHLGNMVSFLLCCVCGLLLYVIVLGVTQSVKDTELSCLYGNLGKRILGLVFR